MTDDFDESALQISADIIQSIWDASETPAAFLAQIAHIHYMQAMVIQGERAQKEALQTAMHMRELHHFETEQIIVQLKAEAEGHADALEDNWESGDLAGAVNETVAFLRGIGNG